MHIRREFISISENFCPEVAVSYGKDHMALLIEAWRDVYHKDVDEVFNRLRKQYE